MIRTTFRYLATGLAWFGFVVLFVLAPAIGSISSVAAVLVALLLSPIAFLRGAWTALRAQPTMLLFLAVFLSLAIIFEVTAREPGDVLLAINFLGLLLAPVAYLLASRRPGGRTIAIMAGLFVLGALIGALTGIFDVLVLHQERATGWAQGGNVLARSVVPIGFMALAGLFAVASRWRWLYLLGPVFALYALYLTGTRGVFIAIPVLGLIFVWALLRQLRAPRVWYAIGAAAVILALGGVAVISPRFLGLGAVFEQVALNGANVSDVATSQRLYMWDAGIHTFIKSPLIGFGWANFTEASLPYGIYFYHNDFLDMAVAAGTVGIVCWLAVLAAPLIGVFAMPRDRFHNLRLYCALILSSSLLIFGITDMTLGYDLPTTLYAFLTAIALGAFREPEPMELSRQ